MGGRCWRRRLAERLDWRRWSHHDARMRTSGEKPSPPLPRFVVESKPRGFRAGVDILHLNRFVGELETDDFLRKEAARRSKR
jgi:hypothetical protein